MEKEILDQYTWLQAWTVIYAFSSTLGFVMSFIVWRMWRADRKGLRHQPDLDPRERQRQNAVGWRNEAMSFLLLTSFSFYVFVSAVWHLRVWEWVLFPWASGTFAIPLIVLGNVSEMLLVAVILLARSELNRD